MVSRQNKTGIAEKQSFPHLRETPFPIPGITEPFEAPAGEAPGPGRAPKYSERVIFSRKTKEGIEWAGWSWNPVTGCRHGCSYCQARDIASRFPERYPKGFEPHLRKDRLKAPQNTPIPDSKNLVDRLVFTVSMGDLFGAWIKQSWIDSVLAAVRNAPPWWIFLFLTKNPKRYLTIDFPKNCWIGATADTQARADEALECFFALHHGEGVGERPPVLFLSLEPLLEKVDLSREVNVHTGSVPLVSALDWIIIGRQTGTRPKQPEWSWVELIMGQARKNKLPVYFKPNLLIRPREYPDV